MLTFEFELETIDEIYGTLTIFRFQSVDSIPAMANGTLDESLCYYAMFNGDETTQIVFVFVDHESKQQWIADHQTDEMN